MKTNKELLIDAFRFGHHWNPIYPNLRNLDLSRVKLMLGSERDAKDLIASWQASDANIDTLSWMLHSRAPRFDGEIGPATQALGDIPRCAMPDHPPPPNASFSYEDKDLQKAVQSYQRWSANRLPGAVGTGSWPVGCDPQRPGVHSTVVAITATNASSHQKESMQQVLALVEKCEAEFGQAVRHVVDGNPPSPQHDVRFQNIPGGVIGYAYFPDPNKCNQTVTARLDNSFNPSALTLANLYNHEYKGHSDGLEHTRGGIMNPSIITINPLSWKGDPSESIKKRYFGGEPVDGPVPPPPPSSHPPIMGTIFGELANGRIVIRGNPSLVLKAGQPVGTFEYTIIPVTDTTFRFVPKSVV